MDGGRKMSLLHFTETERAIDSLRMILNYVYVERDKCEPRMKAAWDNRINDLIETVETLQAMANKQRLYWEEGQKKA
jgi:hypothetical protein